MESFWDPHTVEVSFTDPISVVTGFKKLNCWAWLTLTCILVLGKLCLHGTKKTWTCTQSITCTWASLNSGMELTWITMRLSSSILAPNSKISLGSVLSTYVIKWPWSTQKTYCVSASNFAKLFNTRVNSLFLEQQVTTQDLTPDTTSLRPLISPCLHG